MFLVVFLGDGNGLAEQMDAFPGGSQATFGALIEEGQYSVPDIEASVDDLLESGEVSYLL